MTKGARAHKVLNLPKSAQDLIGRYESLKIQGIEIVCPYHVNSGLFSKNRALVGKGLPEEIETVAEEYLSRFQMYAHGDAERLRTYMIACGIGIDCSGFAAWVLNCVTMESLGKPVWKCLKFPNSKRSVVIKVRPVENISANLLTSATNAVKIEDLRQVMPGDLIRLIHGGHVMVVSEVGLNNDGKATYFAYTESSVSYGGSSGIDTNKVFITHPKGSLRDQKWEDKRVYEALKESGEDARVVRLKVLDNRS
jgi:hypothetical protein